LYFVLALTDNGAADEIALLSMTNHLCASDSTKRSQRGDKVNAFENVRFALGIVAQEPMKSWREIRVQPRVVAEIAESQMSQLHGLAMPEVGKDYKTARRQEGRSCVSPARRSRVGASGAQGTARPTTSPYYGALSCGTARYISVGLF